MNIHKFLNIISAHNWILPEKYALEGNTDVPGNQAAEEAARCFDHVLEPNS
jgi:hypothetical protein